MKKLFLSVLSFITALGAGLIILIEDRRAQDGDISWFDYSKNKSIHLWQSLLQFVCSFFGRIITLLQLLKKTTHHKESNTTAPAQEKPKQNKKIYLPAIINSVKKPTTIAAVSYNTSPCGQQVVSGFGGQLYKDFGDYYTLKYYSAKGSTKRMGKILNQLSSTPPALIFSIGDTTTLSLKKLHDQKDIKIPIIFSGVTDPINLGIIESHQKPNSPFTGVVGREYNYQEQVDLLTLIKPTMKRILICFMPYESWIISNAKKVHTSLEKNKKLDEIILKEYNSQGEFEDNVLQTIDKKSIDTVITLRDILPTSMLDPLVRLCNKKHTTVYASDTASLSRGVGLAYGDSEYYLGMFAGFQAFEVLYNQTSVQKIPTLFLNPENRIWINKSTILHQGIPKADALLTLLKKGELYKNES